MSSNPSSILDSVKKVLGIDSEYTDFDLDVAMHINGALAILLQLGVGPDDGLAIEDSSTLWTDLAAQPSLIGLCKSFVYLQVQLMFDPPPTSFALDSKKAMVEEAKWRVNVEAEKYDPPPMPVLNPPNPLIEWVDPVTRAIYVPVVVQLSPGASVGINAKMGNVFDLETNVDTVISAPFNGIDGQHITLRLISNGHSVTWADGWNFGSAGAPQLSQDGQEDIISAVYNGSKTEWDAGFSPGF